MLLAEMCSFSQHRSGAFSFLTPPPASPLTPHIKYFRIFALSRRLSALITLMVPGCSLEVFKVARGRGGGAGSPMSPLIEKDEFVF